LVHAAHSKENESTGLVPDIAQSQRRLAADQPQISSVTATPSKRWYVAQTHVHAESKATLHLGWQGFEVYLPRYLKQRRHARRVDTLAVPLFPRYLFVSVDMATQRWHSIRSTFGITRLVTNGDVPAVVPQAIIEGLKRREDTNGLVQLERRPRFASGDKIRVLNGAFCDALGLFEGIRDQERVAILLDLLGRKVRVVLDMDIIDAA
jgi:transcriptional antiterminator RfaH